MPFKTHSFEETHEVAKNIDGWLSDPEAKLLYDTVSSLKGLGAIVEIGSWCSKSLTYLTSCAISNGNKSEIISIDPFIHSTGEPNGKYCTFIDNLTQNGFVERVTHIKEKSQVVGQNFDKPIEFVYIDGFHRYEEVKQDFELFFDNVVESGFLALHDVGAYEGPTRLVVELAESDNFRFIELCDFTLLGQKVSELSEIDRQNNHKIASDLKSRNPERLLK